MKKIIKNVPSDVEYINDWKDYSLPRGEHCIVDKGVTGCGYTEYCLRNKDNVVLCSPRRLLLENKSAQHVRDENIHYFINNISDYEDNNSLKDQIKGFYSDCQCLGYSSCKILITYDSTHYAVNALKELGILDDFIFVIDEFQSIFCDAFLKSDVELSFVEVLQDCPSVIYLSATPMLDKYLDQMKEFKDLPFYQLDWSGSKYVERVMIKSKHVNSLNKEAKVIIQNYIDGKFPTTLDSNNTPVESREAVFYLNSVSDIIRIIKTMNLTPSNTLVICSDIEKNRRKLKRIGFSIGKIPLKDEPNPMFMFCTSTSYMGVDMYSDNASTYIFSDPNIIHLATDIHQGLPQIVGRQRNKTNPFKNDINLIFKTQKNLQSREEFDQLQNERRRQSKIILDGFKNLTLEQQKTYVIKLKDGITVNQYSGDFVAISKNTNRPVYNTLIDIANERAWEVSQEDYQCCINVTQAIRDVGTDIGRMYVQGSYYDYNDQVLNEFLQDFFGTPRFPDRMKKYCEFRDEYTKDTNVIESLNYKLKDKKYSNYYEYYGTRGCKSRLFRESYLHRGFVKISKEDIIRDKIYLVFKEGDRVSKSDLKIRLQSLYDESGIDKRAKASDLGKYFELSNTKITLSSGEIVNGFKLGRKV